MISNRPESGRTFQTAMWVVGGIAAMQLFGVFWALMNRPAVGLIEARVDPVLPMDLPPMPLNRGVQSQASANLGGQNVSPPSQPPAFPPDIAPAGQQSPTPNTAPTDLANSMPPVPSLVEGSGAGDLNPGVFPEREDPGAGSLPPLDSSGPILDQPRFVGPAESERNTLSDALSDASFTSDEIADPIVERLVTTGVELRGTDNMQGALQALKEAEAALPDHPRIMSELAATYRQMGLDEKADSYWERVEALGEFAGGDYYPIARRQLRGEEAPLDGAIDQLMKIGDVIIERQPVEGDGEKLAARIVIEADPEIKPDGEKLSVLVFFYDKVNGTEISRSTALTSFLYPTEPYDWQVEGREEIIVNYDQTNLTEEQKRELGERNYFGYVIQLYYRDELQDRVAEPPELEDFHMETTLDAEPQTERLEPENALFPDSPGF